MKIFKLLGFMLFSFLMCTNVMGAAIAPDYTEDELRAATLLAQDVVNFWYSENGRVMFELFAVPATRNMILNSLGFIDKHKWYSAISNAPFRALLCEKVLTEKNQMFERKDIRDFMPHALKWYFVRSSGWIKTIPDAQKLVHTTIDQLSLTSADKWNLDAKPTKRALAQMLQWVIYASIHDKLSACFEKMFDEKDLLPLQQKAAEESTHKHEGVFSLIKDGVQSLLQKP